MEIHFSKHEIVIRIGIGHHLALALRALKYTHMAHKVEHAVDMDSGAIVAVVLHPGHAGDTATLAETLRVATAQLQAAHADKGGDLPIPEVVMGMNAFILGMRSVNPNARMKIVWVNAWYDPGKEGDSAKALIDQGADVIAQHTDSGAPLQVCEQRGVVGFGQASDMISLAPKAQLTASVDFWKPYYVQRTKDAIAGTWTSTDTWGGLASGMLVMAPYANMTDEASAAGKATEADIASGKTVIFQGPIKDQSGAEKVPAGTALDDGAIAGMNWLADGIDGQIPS